ncbi:MAG: class I SAM-dependent methyltransferase [Omnitrophica bacterium]|nr:class I SAM-dependent methyltransferase [Candidatus Omnitrophota bacterium]
MKVDLNYARHVFLKPLKSWKNKYLKHTISKNPVNSLLYQKTLEEISEYTKESVEIVEQKCRSSRSRDVNWENVSENEIIDFYKNEERFLYELPLWNAECNRPEYICRIITPYLKQNKIELIFEYGAGTGDIAMALAERGFKVIYSDINERLINFAKWRFARRKLDIDIYNLDINNQLPKSDCVISFDVLEHLKDLPQKIKIIHSSLSEEGSFVFSGAFSGGELHLIENEIYATHKHLNNMLQARGFTFDNKFAQYYFYRKAKKSSFVRHC